MATETTAAATLPTADQLLLADYKIGSFKSDLELIRQEVERAAGKTISVAEALARVEAEAAPEYDRNEIARLVVLAVDLLENVEHIREEVETIQGVAMSLYHAATGREDWPVQERVVAEWCAEFLGREAVQS